MATKGKEVMIPISEETLAMLRQEYPTEVGFNRTLLPRFGLISQDVIEGKGKNIKVVAEAGTFYVEKQGDEEEEIEVDGKKVTRKKWNREELGTEAEGIVVYQRKQLKYYDESTEKYTSSPVYDTEDEVIPLFLDKKEIARGTPTELKAKYPGTNAAGKAVSLLEENRILYVLLGEESEIFQLNLRGSSMYSFLTYARKTLVPSVLTKFNSEAKEKGSIEWNMMTFEQVRPLTQVEAEQVLEKVGEIKNGITSEKAFYAAQDNTKASSESDEDYADRKKRLGQF